MAHPLRIIQNLKLPKPIGIIHVGAHIGQEFPAYKAAQVKACVYIEPIPEIFDRLKAKIGKTPMHFPVQALCSDVSNEEVPFNVSSSSQSSSMFLMGKVAELYPHHRYVRQIKMTTTTLDEIIYSKFAAHKFDLLVMDAQGAELKILMGSNKLLKDQIKYVYAEVSEFPLYQGGCTFEEVTSYLGLHKLKLKNLGFNSKNWGDGLYVKDDLFEQQQLNIVESLPEPPGESIALNKPAQQSSYSKWSQPNESSRAVNGVKNGSYSFCTGLEVNPWWQVDLEDTYIITQIRVYNRCDNSSAERARTLKLLFSTDGNNWVQVYSNDDQLVPGGVYGEPLIVSIESKIARYVRIQLNEKNLSTLR
ncbi:MAG: FkbM family methyltransferase [Trichodesmium sp. MAG_R04]|nr:FkbM family methyltransferase [Trichodesmium sp. MAG_R04]